MNFIEDCEFHFKTKNIYEILQIPKNSSKQEIKKAYYKLSRKFHPDRVEESQKKDSTEKFKILSKIFRILTNKSKKKIYEKRYNEFFKEISVNDIDKYKEIYIGSEDEKSDVMTSYLNGKGCWDYMLDHVQFMNVEDEPRIAKIIREMIDEGIVPNYEIFTQEPETKTLKRHQKYNKEALEQLRLEKCKEAEQMEAVILTTKRRR